jgi:hypothetical protein
MSAHSIPAMECNCSGEETEHRRSRVAFSEINGFTIECVIKLHKGGMQVDGRTLAHGSLEAIRILRLALTSWSNGNTKGAGKAQAATSSSAKAARSIEKPSAFAGVPHLSGTMVSAGEVCILAAGGNRRVLAKSGMA